MMCNEYGAIQRHLEPEHIKDLLVPVLGDWSMVPELVDATKRQFLLKETARRRQLRLGGLRTSWRES
jgi:type I restriction enzyme M protein